jgi:LAGLIDADG DNA endonuclease family protein
MVQEQGNTVGSRSSIDLAYIAGFLDGDGSLMIQLKHRSESKTGGIRVMLTISFYQDSRHEKPLHWIRKVLGIGYLSHRNDGMTELSINGHQQVLDILLDLLPFLKFKKRQAEVIISSARLLLDDVRSEVTKEKLVDNILIVQSENYVTRRKRSKEELRSLFGLTP